METYEAMRQFADSWGLVGMMAVFLAAVVSTLLPGARQGADQAAAIPFNEAPAKYDAKPDCCGACNGDGACARLAEMFEKDKADV